MTNGKTLLEEMYQPKRDSREFTLNADGETYRIITELSKDVKKSRPKVLAMLVRFAYEEFLKEKESSESEKRVDDPPKVERASKTMFKVLKK